jgi:hypothetical protein
MGKIRGSGDEESFGPMSKPQGYINPFKPNEVIVFSLSYTSLQKSSAPDFTFPEDYA